MSRALIEQQGKMLADIERKSGRLPDSRKIEETARKDFNEAVRGVKPGRDHPLTRSRGGERK